MIELTEQQRQQLTDQHPPRVLDPHTRKQYVLISAEVYDRLRAMLDDDFATAAYPLVMEVFTRDGWDDPAMDVYNDLDPRRPS